MVADCSCYSSSRSSSAIRAWINSLSVTSVTLYLFSGIWHNIPSRRVFNSSKFMLVYLSSLISCLPQNSFHFWSMISLNNGSFEDANSKGSISKNKQNKTTPNAKTSTLKGLYGWILFLKFNIYGAIYPR